MTGPLLHSSLRRNVSLTIRRRRRRRNCFDLSLPMLHGQYPRPITRWAASPSSQHRAALCIPYLATGSMTASVTTALAAAGTGYLLYHSCVSWRSSALATTAAADTNPSASHHTTPSSTPSTDAILACSASAAADSMSLSILQQLHILLQHAFQVVWDSLRVTARGLEITFHLSPLFFLTPAAMASAYLCKDTLLPDMAWKYTTFMVQQLGPSFVKLCQWVATRRDIFPPHICDRLAVLHDRGIPHSWRHTHQTLTEFLGEDYSERGLRVDPQGIVGCGSAAQVYRGTLTQEDPRTGQIHTQTVAIKVLHPHFKRNVERDLWLLETVARLLHALPVERIQMINLPRASANFAAILRRQTDLRIEAANLKQFRSNFHGSAKDEEYSQFVFPRPMDGWITEGVLVEDFVHNATPITTFLQDSSPEGMQIRKQLGVPLFNAFLKMLFLDNFVHCDLHPGNIQVVSINQGSTSHPQRKIALLDAGITFSLDPNDQKNLRDLFRAVVLNDGNKAGRLMVERARYERCSQVEGGIDAFAAGMEAIVSEFHDRRKGGLTFGAVRIGALLNRVLDLCRVYGVEIDPAMSSVVVSCLVLEGLARSLEPSLNLMEAAVPFVMGRGRV